MATESTVTATIAGELVSADKIEEAPALSTSADKMESLDVASEAKKLLGLEQKHLVMGNIPLPVNAFQEAASLLGKKYGEPANECGEAFFLWEVTFGVGQNREWSVGECLGRSACRKEEEKTEDEALVENNDNVDEEAREELREQVYGAMGEKEAKKAKGKSLSKPETGTEQEREVKRGGREDMDISEPAEELQGKVESTSNQLTEPSGEAKEAAIPALNEAEVASGKTEQASLCAEEGKSVSGAYVQNKECRETVDREKERK
ncbi:Nuclear autoantigenic sperm protein [Microtus ochrogaster]|uniref:Nuclear autoantigenic sperm protein n=1 Tax=Microtus ochrogaster TaxID=79684 RepID=A0A8J6GB10_MICOH|nr:Nuclear autoantigenic sperm protein [Microtus ochrogaster]